MTLHPKVRACYCVGRSAKTAATALQRKIWLRELTTAPRRKAPLAAHPSKSSLADCTPTSGPTAPRRKQPCTPQEVTLHCNVRIPALHRKRMALNSLMLQRFSSSHSLSLSLDFC